MLKRGHVLDIYDDADGVHVRDGALLKKYGQLHVDPAEKISSLKDKDFALVVMTKAGEKVRKFPIHSPEALALSAHYLSKTGSQLPAQALLIAASNMVRSHLRFGCDVPEELAKQASADVEGPYFNEGTYRPVEEAVPAAAMGKYAYERMLSNGSTVKMFPVDDAQIARRSAETFSKIAYEIPARARFEGAIKLAAALRQLGVRNEFVEKTAALTPNPAFRAHMDVRRGMVTDDESLKTLDSIQKLAGALHGPMIAAAVEEFDVRTGISHLWDIKVRNPWDSCFTVKEASVKVGDRSITKEALVKLLDSGKLASMFKESTIKEFKSNPMVIFESLPEPTKQTISQMIS